MQFMKKIKYINDPKKSQRKIFNLSNKYEMQIKIRSKHHISAY